MYSDVLIVGGGMAGSALGCALATSSLFSKITVIDTTPIPKAPENEVPDPRCVTLTPISQKFMRSIGTWNLIEEKRRAGFKEMKVWDYYGTGSMLFEDSYGWVLENKAITHANMTRLSQFPNVEILAPAKVKGFSVRTGEVEVELEDGQKLTTSLVVGADGKESKVRNDFKIGAWRSTYPHCGLVCTVKADNKVPTAYQRFLKTGPIALLPFWDDYYSIVWSLPPLEAERLKKIPPAQFIEELNKALHDPSIVSFPVSTQLDAPMIREITTDRFSFPYALQHASKFVDSRVALIGDAAHTIHPMAGQGYNLGVYDVINLAHDLCEAAKVGKDPGSLMSLENYATRSRLYNTLFAGFEQFILWNYTDFGLIHYWRNANFSLINNIPPLKSLFQAGANGTYYVPSHWSWVSEMPPEEIPF
ncbi:unnamed protein product [Blepharisma stoltei]|uniref:FAD-binding domain-containing protein n=1 Tax=Blepharisma stoltei TaxID=1481888 RepID=A0AAU9JNX7_9CILI|nr:unnamed protein product [Blepharisma stoltei]